ncbi:GGDEF domain-containing protein [Thalassotalea euphylliae]|uniref:diguanylate cyclase n=1 Tax=Thalassotalea euphylliae TaxID=1655234 RepID=A0A3E0TRH1_9GAMM|nr:GGDEF domain-containing protein [Thalassotalea euphylliae]REL26535.1 GGDEF domain-containing protein [Thalassotalea euphylliae]
MTEQAKQQPKQHPIIKTNYLPRCYATVFLLSICGLKLGESLLELQYLWLFILGVCYPHVTYFLAKHSQNGKRQEHINIHVDAFISGILVSIQPDYYMLSTMGIILCVNALYIGAFRMLVTCIFVYAIALALGMGYLWPFAGFVEASWAVQIMISIFILIYFCTFAILSYYLTRRMIALNKEVQSLSIIDGLTKAYNRHYLDANLTKEIHRSQRLNYPLTVIFADLDHFKQINDTYGHQIGDKVLIEFVNIAATSVREDVDWIARFGGEEFVIVLPNADSDYGASIAERIRQDIDQHLFEFDGQALSVSSSFGVVSIASEGNNASMENIIACADSGLYKAKANGRNCVEVVDFYSTAEQPS